MLLNFSSLLISGFVFASHILVGGVALIMMRQRGYSMIPLLKRLVWVFAVTTFLSFQLYATILPQAYVVMQTEYTTSSAGYSPFFADFWRELIRGISAGFGTGVIFAALPFLIVVGFGFFILLQRQWILTLALVLPGVLNIIFLITKGLAFSPRFFLLFLPLAILAAVQGIYSLAIRVSDVFKKEKKLFIRFAVALVFVICIMSLISLRYYYSVPKQAYRATIAYIESEQKPGEITIAIHPAATGYQYYAKRLGLKEGKDYFSVHSREDFDAVLSSQGEKRIFLVTTLHRLLRLEYPDINMRIEKDWTLVRTFPGTITNSYPLNKIR